MLVPEKSEMKKNLTFALTPCNSMLPLVSGFTLPLVSGLTSDQATGTPRRIHCIFPLLKTSRQGHASVCSPMQIWPAGSLWLRPQPRLLQAYAASTPDPAAGSCAQHGPGTGMLFLGTSDTASDSTAKSAAHTPNV